VKAALRTAKYYTYRDGPDRGQRTWHTSDGHDQRPYDEIKAAIHADAQTYGYTYRIVLSTKDAELTPAEYRQVLGDRFERYYFIEHHNTDYPHAHVIAFRKQLVKQGELQEMRGNVLELEQARVQERQAQPGRAHALTQDIGD
jgi:hypothetical protein